MMEDFVYFKGKSKEKILKSIEGLSFKEKFKKAIDNKCDWLLEDCLNSKENIYIRKTLDKRGFYIEFENIGEFIIIMNRLHPLYNLFLNKINEKE
jgi:hypothetical protein